MPFKNGPFNNGLDDRLRSYGESLGKALRMVLPKIPDSVNPFDDNLLELAAVIFEAVGCIPARIIIRTAGPLDRLIEKVPLPVGVIVCVLYNTLTAPVFVVTTLPLWMTATALRRLSAYLARRTQG